jgi:hypothetical protein
MADSLTVDSGKPVLKTLYKDSNVQHKMSKETKKKIADKIKYLMDKEGKSQEQAIAMAYHMEAPKHVKKKK